MNNPQMKINARQLRRHVLALAALSALALTTAPLALAQDAEAATKEELPEARTLVDRYVEAVGGAESIRRQSTGTVTGRFEISGAGVSGPLTVASRGPGKQAVLIELAGMGEIRSGVDGDLVWSVDPFMGPRILEGEEKAMQVEMASPEALLRGPEYVSAMETVGLAEFDDEPCYRVRVEWKSGRESFDCYAKDDGLLIATEAKQVSPMGEVEVTTLLKDYRELSDGLIAATRAEQTVMGQQQVMILEAFDPAVPADEVFELPAPIKALRGSSGAPADEAAPAPDAAG